MSQNWEIPLKLWPIGWSTVWVKYQNSEVNPCVKWNKPMQKNVQLGEPELKCHSNVYNYQYLAK